MDPPAGLVTPWLVILGAERFIPEPSEDTRELYVAPFPFVSCLKRQVGHLLVITNVRRDIFVDQAQVTRVDVVGGMLQCRCHLESVPVPEGPAELGSTKEHHSSRAPIIDHVGEQVAVHEETVGLASQEGSPARIHVTHAHGCLARIRADTVEIELELRFVRLFEERARSRPSEARLANAEDRLAIGSEFTPRGRYSRWPKRCLPVGIDPVEILDRVEL